jgi:L-ascorbate metabolism protein UlaG (beta-lactamase superfamily)
MEVGTMKLQWLGTAGFKVEAGDQLFLIDPYLTRNARAMPRQSLQPGELSGAGQIFITHGHFDHLHDVPAIMERGQSTVYCSEVATAALTRDGADNNRITAVSSDGYVADFGGYKAEAFFSRHVKFDIPLVARALWRIGPGYNRLSAMHRNYPPGQVLSWRFTIGGYTMHHFGSAGSPPEELQSLAIRPIDLLLVPLQGHTRICDITLEFVRILKPRLVIPHHQDDFYPPISTYVDIAPFIAQVRKKCPASEVRVMEINEVITL